MVKSAFLVCAYLAVLCSSLEAAPNNRLEEMQAKVKSVLASAVKDEKGLVTPQEYGRLLNELIAKISRLRYLEDYPGIVDDYIQTLSGPVDPENILSDFITGDFSRIIMNPDLMRRRIKRDL